MPAILKTTLLKHICNLCHITRKKPDTEKFSKEELYKIHAYLELNKVPENYVVVPKTHVKAALKLMLFYTPDAHNHRWVKELMEAVDYDNMYLQSTKH